MLFPRTNLLAPEESVFLTPTLIAPDAELPSNCPRKPEVMLAAPTPKFVPSNTNAVPLVATLEALRYNTPLAVPPERVRLLLTVAEATETLVMLRLLIVRLVRARLVMLADAARSTVAERSETVAVVAIRLVMVALVAVRFVTVKLLVPKSAM